MRKDITRLNDIAAADEKTIIGLMSGTSMDGLDIALCRICGHGRQTRVEVLRHDTITYGNAYRQKLSEVAFKKDAPLEQICLLNKWVAVTHAVMLNETLAAWGYIPGDVDLIASHGQTVFHAPLHTHGQTIYGHASLQIGDGDELAVLTGMICVSDFRQKHIAAGGEGAPLAAYGDYLLYGNDEEDIVLLNIGGISNISFIPARASLEDVVAGDTGPGNKIMDGYINSIYPDRTYDAGGEWASQGSIDDILLNSLLSHDYFKMDMPKTTGPELFNLDYLLNDLSQSEQSHIPPPDIMATLNMFTAESIAISVRKLPAKHKRKILVSGGGAKNSQLMRNLQTALPDWQVTVNDRHAIPPDAKEAVLFAVLANELLSGDVSSYGKATGNGQVPLISMGKISLPH